MNHDGRTRFGKTAFQLLTMQLHQHRTIGAITVSGFECGGHSRDQGDRLRARPAVGLLVPAEMERRERDTAPHEQPADAARAVELVRPERERRRAKLLERNRDLADRLDRVEMRRHACGVAAFDERCHILDHTGLVVCEQR